MKSAGISFHTQDSFLNLRLLLTRIHFTQWPEFFPRKLRYLDSCSVRTFDIQFMFYSYMKHILYAQNALERSAAQPLNFYRSTALRSPEPYTTCRLQNPVKQHVTVVVDILTMVSHPSVLLYHYVIWHHILYFTTVRLRMMKEIPS